MHIIVPDDYSGAVRDLDALSRLAGHTLAILGELPPDLDAQAAALQDADALVLIRERTPVSAALLDRLPHVKLISQTGRGTPHIDLAACTARGIAVAVGGGSAVAPAELTWALVMAALRHIPAEAADLRAGQWQAAHRMGRELRGRTLGVFGYGKIGTLVAGYGRAFGMRVLVWGRDGSQARAQADGFAIASSQRVLFEQSDVLSLHLRLAPETRGIVTHDDLAAMRPDALLVNTSRAGLIAPGALLAALRNGRPGSAAVDVFEQEPARNDPLLALPNVLATPHLGYVTRETYEVFFGEAFDHVRAFFAGEPVELLNPEVRAPGRP